MAAASCLLGLSRCDSKSQNRLSQDLPQLNIMQIFQSDLDLCLTKADYRFLETNDHSFGSNSSCCFRSMCNVSIACLPMVFSRTHGNIVWLPSGDMTLPVVTFPYHC